jgi:hypothetical protein
MYVSETSVGKRFHGAVYDAPTTMRCGREKLLIVASSLRISPNGFQELRQFEMARLEVKLWTSFA